MSRGRRATIDAVITRCPGCEARYRVDAARLKDGRGRIRCARCEKVFEVRSEEEDAAPPAAGEPAPPAESPERPAAVQRILDASRGSGTGLAVAVVACEAGALREKVVSVLARAGVRTLTTDDGPACIDMARRTRARLVVAASYLHGLTGPEVAEALRREPALASARIVLLAAGGDEAPQPGSLGVDAIASATMRPEDLELLLGDLLAEKRPEARPDGEQEAALERACRVLAAELRLYHSGEDGALRRGPLLEADLQAAREWCSERWPGREHLAHLLLESELEQLLGD